MKPFSYIIFFAIILLSSSLAQSKGGRWQFENNGFDTADWDLSNDNGTLIDTASYSSAAPLQEGTSYLWLDAEYTLSHFKIEDSNDLDFSDENIGLSAWINPTLLNTTHFFISKGTQNSDPITTNYSLRVSKTKKLEFLLHDSGQTKKVSSSFTIPINQWTFVAAYYDFSAHKVYMWNNPQTDAVDTLDFTQSFSANDGPLTIGGRYVDNVDISSSNHFKGRIDDVRISGRLDDIISQDLTAIEDSHTNMITAFQLNQNYPNPFNPSTKISFYLPSSKFVSLKIYDSQGKLITTIFEKKLKMGNHVFTWTGDHYASGAYFYQLNTARFSQTKKMIYMK